MSMTFATDVIVDSSHNLTLQGLKIFYGTCSTAAATNPKVVSCTGFTSSDLVAGTLLFVKFTNTATTTAVADLQMNVNSTGAKNIKKLYNGALNNVTTIGEIQANLPLIFAYSGTYWVLLGSNYNTTYTTMSVAEAEACTATSSRIIRPDRLGAAIKRLGCVKINVTGINSLPKTYTATGLTASHEMVKYLMSNTAVMGSDWTVTTAADSFTISGTFSGSGTTNLTMYFAIPETITATSS